MSEKKGVDISSLLTEAQGYPREPFWNHRVVRKVYRPGTEFEEVHFEIREAHYPADVSVASRPTGLTVDAIGVYGESLEELRAVLERMLRALDKPVIDEAEWDREREERRGDQ